MENKKPSLNNNILKKGAYLILVGGVAFGGSLGAIGLSSNDKVVVQQASNSSSLITTSANSSLSSEDLAKKIVPSVVAITTENVTTSNYWFGNQVESGAGSGVIMSSDGSIITCAHVVTDADNIMVETADGKSYEATIVGEDTSNDIAVIKIDASNLAAATFGDSDKVSQGESSYAVGNPEGEFSGSITQGIISALNREIEVSVESSDTNTQRTYSNMMQSNSQTIKLTVLQTDAAVSPGNSGGGLFNASGELIGIVSAKSSQTESEGLGFAIVSNNALSVAKDLINNAN